MIEHLQHMAAVRPAGLDRDAAEWAVEDGAPASWQAELSNIKAPGFVYVGAPSDPKEKLPSTAPLALCIAAFKARASLSP